MDKRILLCVDATFSPATQTMVRAVGQLVQQADSNFSFLLLHSIPMIQAIAGQPGYYIEQQVALTPSPEQRKQAEAALYQARIVLQEYGIQAENIEDIVRIGTIADEIVQVARDRRVNLIAVGSKGAAFRFQVRRLFLGSISRRILQLAPCPVMIVTAPQSQQQLQDKELVSWYEEALKGYLKARRQILTVLTSQQVAQLFLPPGRKTPERQEIDAATRALDRLANAGLLCRRDVEGEIYYIND